MYWYYLAFGIKFIGSWQFIGLLLAIATWFAGADKQVYQHAHQAGFELPTKQDSTPVATGDLPAHPEAVEVKLPATTNQTTTSLNDDPNKPAAPLPTGSDLPKAALFSMSYKSVAAQQLGEYQGQYIRLTQKIVVNLKASY